MEEVALFWLIDCKKLLCICVFSSRECCPTVYQDHILLWGIVILICQPPKTPPLNPKLQTLKRRERPHTEFRTEGARLTHVFEGVRGSVLRIGASGVCI